MREKPAAAPEGARTVGRVLRALELLASQSEPLRLMEVARGLDMPTSSAHALLQQLIKYDYVTATGQERRYLAGPGLALLGSRVRAGLQIVRAARPVIEELAASTGENVYVGICSARGIAYADSVEAESGVMARFPLGSIRPPHATSPGKLFLAFRVPAGRLDSVIGALPLPALTRYSTTDRVKLRQQVEQIRSRGYALNEQEAVEGAFGVSTPIFDADGVLAGCITVGIPGVRFRSSRDTVIKKAIAAAAEVSRKLGVENWGNAVSAFSSRDEAPSGRRRTG